MNEPSQTDSDPDWKNSIYDELHRFAKQALARESPGHSLQPTLLVNDAYLRLLEQNNVDLQDRPLVLAAGATIIRRLLVDYARRRKAQKRGGPKGRGSPLIVAVTDGRQPLNVLELNDALDALSKQHSRAAKTVELKFFGGLSGQEIADHLAVSLRTVNNDWQYAKAWLYRQMGSTDRVAENDG